MTRYLLVLLFLFVVLPDSTASSAESPRLRVESGTHLGPIHLLSGDDSGRYLITAGQDATVRIWDAPRGELLQTVYFERRAQPAQQSLLAALSADGQVLATYHHKQGVTDPPPKLVLSMWRTGQTVAQIQPEAAVIGFRFSSATAAAGAGRSRLAVLLRSGVIDIYDVSLGTRLGSGTCTPECSDFQLDSAQRLLTLSSQGVLKVYDDVLKLQHEGQLPASIRTARFAPDGTKLAVVAEQSGQLGVFSVPALQSLFQPDLQGTTGTLVQLAWATDGDALYGSTRSKTESAIRRWARAGQGQYVDLLPAPSAEPSPLRALHPLQQEGVAYVTDTGAVVAVAANRKVLYRKERTLPDFALPGASLLVDRTGKDVRFSITSSTMISFSVTERSFQRSTPFGVRYVTPASAGDGWKLSGSLQELQQEGTPLTLLPGEFVHSRALTPGAALGSQGSPSLLFLGTDRGLLAFDQKGQQRFRTEVVEGVRLLAVSGDGQLIVAGLGDGSLRWYAAADGHPLFGLVFAPHTERWIAFSASGYYDAAVNGESLAGMQVHTVGRSTDDFFPLSVFRAHRYRPELIPRMLSSLDEERSLIELDSQQSHPTPRLPIEKLLPPIVNILDPKDGAQTKDGQVSMRVLVRSGQEQTPVQLRAFVEGRLTQTRGLRLVNPTEQPEGVREQVFDLSVETPAEDCTVTVIAARGEQKSVPTSLRLRGHERTAKTAVQKPNLYMLSIGVGDYPRDNIRLHYPAKDAQDLARTLSEQRGRQYGQVEVRELTDRTATRDNILEGLAWLRSSTTANDVAVLFLAGHGISDPTDGRYYFLPYDEDLTAPASTMVDAGQIQAALAAIRGRVLLLLDTCHSGNILMGRGGRAVTDFSRVVNEMASADSGVVVYAAASGNQASQESPQWNNGAFTKAVIEGLKGRADYTSSGRITVSALEHYVGERVRQLTMEAQTPTTAKPTTITDFSLALVSTRSGLLKKAWFWTLVGVTVAAGASTAIGLGVASRGPDTTGLPVLRPFAN